MKGELRQFNHNNVSLAYRHITGSGPTIMFLPSYMADMSSPMSTGLRDWGQRTGRAVLCFDYSGCGASDGEFEDGTIGRWRDEALALADHVAAGPLLLVGASLGGWIALLLARAMPERVKALVLAAPAPDFLDACLLPSLGPEQRRELIQIGRLEIPRSYAATPYIFTRRLIEDARHHMLLHGPIDYRGPVRLLHGLADSAVPWRQSVTVVERLQSRDAQLTLIKDGDHFLSRPTDLSLLTQNIEEAMGLVEQENAADKSGNEKSEEQISLASD